HRVPSTGRGCASVATGHVIKTPDLLLSFVAEKATLADEFRHLRWHHFVPALVAAGDALEHVTRKDRQIFRVEIIELHEAAAAYQVIIERLQLGFHLERVNGL